MFLCLINRCIQCVNAMNISKRINTGVVGATAMNVSSSRSHAIFTITVESSQIGEDGEQHVKMGKLHLVDLAVRLICVTRSSKMLRA